MKKTSQEIQKERKALRIIEWDKNPKLCKVGYTVKLLMKEELNDIFEYVRTTYNVKKFEELYDDSGKYLHKYVCDNCGKEFETYVKRKKVLKFCSNVCAGKYMRNRRNFVTIE